MSATATQDCVIVRILFRSHGEHDSIVTCLQAFKSLLDLSRTILSLFWSRGLCDPP